MEVAIATTDYVGLSNILLLEQHHEEAVLDIKGIILAIKPQDFSAGAF